MTTIDDLPDDAPALYPLIAILPNAHGMGVEELNQILTDEWEDEDSTWNVAMNGLSIPQFPAVSTVGDEYPDPARVEVPPGSFLVSVDQEALVVVHPTRLEWFTNPGDMKASGAWEHAAVQAVRDRLADLGVADEDGEEVEVPDAIDFIDPDQRDEFADDPDVEAADD